jgi:DNA-binding response OmpR family regulator
LLIEDEPELAAATLARLEAEGFVVDHFGSLRTAIEAVMMAQYRAVLLDRRLPDGDGLSLLPVLKTRPQPPPVIVLTAMDDIPDRVEGLDSGAEDYLISRSPSMSCSHGSASCCGVRALRRERRASGSASSNMT